MGNILSVYEEGNSFYGKLETMNMDSLKLGSQVVYNLVCVSSEALLSSLLMTYNEELEHGSVSAMLRTASKYISVSDELMDGVRFMNRFHTWCSLDAIPARQATSEELKRMVLCVEQIRDLVKRQLIDN